MTSDDRSTTYYKFLNLLNAVRDLSSFPSLDALEERLLNTLAATWHSNMRITVVEAMNILPGTSTATVYRRLTSLRKKGLLEIQLDETDLRVKYVLPTKAATDYFSQLADCLVKASRR
jgi:DNA-binding MarR family transcriptional regulator